MSKEKKEKKEKSKKSKKSSKKTSKKDKSKHKKNDRKRERSASVSSSSSTSSSSSSSVSIEENIEREERRSMKKASKVAKMLGYTNDINPFGDSNLLQPFVWGKKKEKESVEGKVEENTSEKRIKLMEEIDRVRKRRDMKEKEQEEMERLRAEEQRLREGASYADWERKEEQFHLEQTRIRSKIRLMEGRVQPIDLLAKNMLLIEAAASWGTVKTGLASIEDSDAGLRNMKFELRDPISLLIDLEIDQLDQLQFDIDNYLQLELKQNGTYQEFWISLKVIVLDEKKKKLNYDNRNDALHKAVAEEGHKLFKGKELDELESLESDINKMIRDGKCTDIQYWERMLKEIVIYKAKAVVNSTHRNLLKKKAEILATFKSSGADDNGKGEIDENIDYMAESVSNMDSVIIGPDGNIRNIGAHDNLKDNGDLMLLKDEADNGLGLDERNMDLNDEISLTQKQNNWNDDKLKPRKPRYINKIRTGFDWNRYNSAHYDKENPPPRTIQGYKFTIFYPDLIDKTKTPKYYLEACENPDFCIIRFHGGPPYEDVAFRILNKQWDIGRHTGFKCIFASGILQLHFNYKRQFYRR
jgi:hypothetical protein